MLKYFSKFADETIKTRHMKRITQFLLITALIAMAGCVSVTTYSNRNASNVKVIHDTIKVAVLPPDTLTYNLPCQIINIHPELEGKAMLFLWLHGGVHDQKIHSYFTHRNHWDNCAADDSIVHYLRRHGIKAIALLPMCHKADLTKCVNWIDCYDDVKHMIDNLVDKNLVDPKRIYVAGSSDGGRGTWDFVAQHPEVFAAAISMSCSEPQKTSVPTYFFNTSDEDDCTQLVTQLKKEGANILDYQYCSQYRHGGDAALCTDAMLSEFFSHILPRP